MQCATHPNIETELACSRCGKAICPRCMVQTPVGARCRECAQVRRIPTYNISAGIFARAIGGALVGGVVVGFAWWFFYVANFGFFAILFGLAAGYAIGEIVSVAANRRAGPPLQAIAVAGVALAYIVRVALIMSASGAGIDFLRIDLWGPLAAIAAGFVAAGRLR